jgi:hypothetical protein
MTGDFEAEFAAPLDGMRVELRGQLCIGGVSVGIAGGRNTDVIFDSEHERFRVETGASDIELRVEWVSELAPTPGCTLFDSGTTWRLYQHEAGFQFDFGDPIAEGRPYKRLLVDRNFCRAGLQMSAEYFSAFPHAADPLGYPLDELLIMHRLTQERAIELHGCGIVRADGIGNLFVGHSGAGKSTTTQLWTEREDVEILSDDRIIVRRNEGPQIDLEEKQTPRSARNDKEIIGAARKFNMRMYGTPWHGEAMYASPNSAPLARIFVLEHGQGNVVTQLSPSQAVAELFARSFVPFHRHEYVESALSFLEEVVGTVPVYRFLFEPDSRAVDTILQFHD